MPNKIDVTNSERHIITRFEKRENQEKIIIQVSRDKDGNTQHIYTK